LNLTFVEMKALVAEARAELWQEDPGWRNDNLISRLANALQAALIQQAPNLSLDEKALFMVAEIVEAGYADTGSPYATAGKILAALAQQAQPLTDETITLAANAYVTAEAQETRPVTANYHARECMGIALAAVRDRMAQQAQPRCEHDAHTMEDGVRYGFNGEAVERCPVAAPQPEPTCLRCITGEHHACPNGPCRCYRCKGPASSTDNALADDLCTHQGTNPHKRSKWCPTAKPAAESICAEPDCGLPGCLGPKTENTP
jgi:hypothetical protein